MKTVYLIVSGGFLAFGPGCYLSCGVPSTYGFPLLACSPSGKGIVLHVAPGRLAVGAHLAIWASAIASAPDGALLRWDDELQCVVDELTPADVFAEDEPREEIDLRENEVPDDYCPACAGSGQDPFHGTTCAECEGRGKIVTCASGCERWGA